MGGSIGKKSELFQNLNLQGSHGDIQNLNTFNTFVLKGFLTIFVRISQHEILLTTEFGPPKNGSKSFKKMEALIAGLGEEEVDFGLSLGVGIFDMDI